MSLLPFYKCHKVVRAGKIIAIQREVAPLMIAVELPDRVQVDVPVDVNYFERHNPHLGGYFIVYADGYTSFSPAGPFESGYGLMRDQPGVGMTFGDAIQSLKNGRRVARAGWNGKGMYLWLLPAAKVKFEWCREPHLKAVADANGGEIEALGSIRMMTADRKVLTGWLASQTDVLSEDWAELPD